MTMPQAALKYEVAVTAEGHIDIPIPFPPGSRVIVFVVEAERDDCSDLVSAAQSSVDFWDNPLDDEDWNHA